MRPLIKSNWLLTTSLLVLIHIIGIIGILSPYQVHFLKLTPVTILLTAYLLFSHHQAWSKGFIIFCGMSWMISFLLEVIAVKSGLIFGVYHYETNLGWQLWNVPVLIGVNWLMLIYAVGNMLYPLPMSIPLKSVLGAALMVLLDRLIEPVAIRLGFWQWNNQEVPLQNYIIWYMLSWLLLRLFYNLDIYPYNKIGRLVYFTLLTFFGFLSSVLA